jgi:hypothetical protein
VNTAQRTLDGHDLLAHRVSASLTAGAALLAVALAVVVAAIVPRRRGQRRLATSPA